MKLTLAVKLTPTPEQHAALVATLERFNAACNAIAAVAARERLANKFALHKIVYHDVRARFDLSSQMTVRAIAKVVEAYKRDKAVQPLFRPHGALTYDERIMSWKGLEHVSLLALDGRHLVACRFGPYQQARRHSLRGQADLILRDGTFYLHATLDVADVPTTDVDEFLGVDLGIVNIATDSDATVYTGEGVEQQRRTFAHRRRNLQRRQTRSAKRKLQSLRRKQARFQRDSNHCISKALVRTAKDTGRGIAMEDLQGIRERVSVRRRQRARHTNWAFAQLNAFVQYKAAGVGVPIVVVDPRYTSQTCLACGHVDRANRPSQARFECVVCAFAGPADAVAACVISARARAAVMRPNVDQPVGKVAEWEHGSAASATKPPALAGGS
jgi:IS605 OrfB family transposase